MKNTVRIILLCLTAICAVVCASAAFTSAATPVKNTVEAGVTEQKAAEYTLRLENGEIVISSEGCEDIKTGITGQWLREADREILKAGITVDSYEEIIKLLEDYNS